MLWYLRSPPPPPTSPVSPSGVPVTGAQKGGGSGKGAQTPPPPPPPRASQFSPSLSNSVDLPITLDPFAVPAFYALYASMPLF